jgi:hypothetical protein
MHEYSTLLRDYVALRTLEILAREERPISAALFLASNVAATEIRTAFSCGSIGITSAELHELLENLDPAYIIKENEAYALTDVGVRWREFEFPYEMKKKGLTAIAAINNSLETKLKGYMCTEQCFLFNGEVLKRIGNKLVINGYCKRIDMPMQLQVSTSITIPRKNVRYFKTIWNGNSSKIQFC